MHIEETQVNEDEVALIDRAGAGVDACAMIGWHWPPSSIVKREMIHHDWSTLQHMNAHTVEGCHIHPCMSKTCLTGVFHQHHPGVQHYMHTYCRMSCRYIQYDPNSTKTSDLYQQYTNKINIII